MADKCRITIKDFPRGTSKADLEAFINSEEVKKLVTVVPVIYTCSTELEHNMRRRSNLGGESFPTHAYTTHTSYMVIYEPNDGT